MIQATTTLTRAEALGAGRHSSAPCPNRGQTYPLEHRFWGYEWGYEMSTAENAPTRSSRTHLASATDILYDYGGHSRLAELASAKGIETFLVDDIE